MQATLVLVSNCAPLLRDLPKAPATAGPDRPLIFVPASLEDEDAKDDFADRASLRARRRAGGLGKD